LDLNKPESARQKKRASLLWIAQGKSNADIATILGCAENTIKVHSARIFEKLGVENRNAAAMRALELLSSPSIPTK
jgi:DNA-binding CsgD family transcriptional regulator